MHYKYFYNALYIRNIRIFFVIFTFHLSCMFYLQGSKGERGPMGVPGGQGLTGTKGDKVCDHMNTVIKSK